MLPGPFTVDQSETATKPVAAYYGRAFFSFLTFPRRHRRCWEAGRGVRQVAQATGQRVAWVHPDAPAAAGRQRGRWAATLWLVARAGSV